MSERKSKGTILNVLKGHVVARYGEAEWQRVLAYLSADDRQIVESAVAIGWYPTPILMRTYTAFAEVLGPAHPQLLAEFGRVGAEQDLTVFHRMFLRMANPAFVVEKTGDYWARFHTHGTWQSRRANNGYVGTLTDFQSNAIYCAVLTPYITRLLELVGAKQVVVHHPECNSHGAKACVFTARWS